MLNTLRLTAPSAGRLKPMRVEGLNGFGAFCLSAYTGPTVPAPSQSSTAFGPERMVSNLSCAACEEAMRSGWLVPAHSANAATAVPPAGMLNGPAAIRRPMSRELSAVWANPDFIQSAFVVLVKLSAPAPEQVRARKLRVG